MDYLDRIWLTPHKEMFVSALPDQVLHFGNQTTNRVESQHSKLKNHLETTQADLKKILSHIQDVPIPLDAVDVFWKKLDF